jgi:hypothetical protein
MAYILGVPLDELKKLDLRLPPMEEFEKVGAASAQPNARGKSILA